MGKLMGLNKEVVIQNVQLYVRSKMRRSKNKASRLSHIILSLTDNCEAN